MHTRNEETRVIKITDIKVESSDITSIWFKDKEVRNAQPGQYVMLWIPGIDEVPMSISAININSKSRVSVRVVGEATEALVNHNVGDKIGIRGPFGKGYEIKGKNQLFVAGGSGAASLMPLLEIIIKKGHMPTFVLGARTADRLIYVDRLHELLNENLIISTDDGSKGFSGFASGYSALLMDAQDFDQIYTCGPEIMMVKVNQAAETRDIPIQASLERFVKCAVGLCGNCAIGPYRVCKDGPVFDSKMLREVIDEFGVSRMDATGRNIRVNQ